MWRTLCGSCWSGDPPPLPCSVFIEEMGLRVVQRRRAGGRRRRPAARPRRGRAASPAGGRGPARRCPALLGDWKDEKKPGLCMVQTRFYSVILFLQEGVPCAFAVDGDAVMQQQLGRYAVPRQQAAVKAAVVDHPVAAAGAALLEQGGITAV